MIQRRWLAMVGVLVIAALLAFPLRRTVHDAIVVPIAYLLWGMGLLYRALAQIIWWILLVVLVIMILGNSLMPAARPAKPASLKSRPPRGQVDDLSNWIKKSHRGVYFKWLVANRLGKMAHQLLCQRAGGEQRSVFAPLVGPDWDPSLSLRWYLEAGLHGSFADFPNAISLLDDLLQRPWITILRMQWTSLKTKCEQIKVRNISME